MLERIIRNSIMALGLAGMIAGCTAEGDEGLDDTDPVGIEEEPYGCEDTDAQFDEIEPNSLYEGDISMRFYITPTGILFDGGELLQIDVSGEGCWYQDMCNGPDDVPQQTWGVYGGYRQMPGENPVNMFKVGSHYEGTVELPPTGTHELLLMIPDGSDSSYCDEYLYQDNSGYFDAVVRKEYPSQDQDGGFNYEND